LVIASLLIRLLACIWRRLPALALTLVVSLALTGCTGIDMGGIFGESKPQPPQPPQPPIAGGVKVALLLPLSAQGETARIATSMKQAAEMAMFDAGNPGITLITKDSGGTPAGAQGAAQAALAEGAELILGPLLASEVQAVSPLARQANVPVIAFSTSSAVAGSGTYLMSFLPEEEVTNIVRYAAQTGLRSIGAFLPRSSYGNSVEKALVTSAKVYGARVVAIERYERSLEGMSGPAGRLAERLAGGMQALLVPEGGEVLRLAGSALATAGITPASLRMLGTGLWDDSLTPSTPIAVGGWYAGVAPDLVARFAQRFQRSYGANPPRIASLSYDAVSLAIILGRGEPGARFTAQNITNPQGFQGVNGLFRFTRAGLAERGLSILEVTPAGPRVVAPAPLRFGIGS
jgi:ABC-type branched-subunit amino acid transport system substrate-binding protein